MAEKEEIEFPTETEAEEYINENGIENPDVTITESGTTVSYDK